MCWFTSQTAAASARPARGLRRVAEPKAGAILCLSRALRPGLVPTWDARVTAGGFTCCPTILASPFSDLHALVYIKSQVDLCLERSCPFLSFFFLV